MGEALGSVCGVTSGRKAGGEAKPPQVIRKGIAGNKVVIPDTWLR